MSQGLWDIIATIGALAIASNAKAADVPTTERARAPQPAASVPTELAKRRLDTTRAIRARGGAPAPLFGGDIGTAVRQFAPPDQTAGDIGTAVQRMHLVPQPPAPGASTTAQPVRIRRDIPTRGPSRRPTIDPPVVDPPVDPPPPPPVDDINGAISWLWDNWMMSPAQLWARWVMMPMADAVRLFNRIHEGFIVEFQEVTWQRLLQIAAEDYGDQFEPYDPR